MPNISIVRPEATVSYEERLVQLQELTADIIFDLSLLDTSNIVQTNSIGLLLKSSLEYVDPIVICPWNKPQQYNVSISSAKPFNASDISGEVYTYAKDTPVVIVGYKAKQLINRNTSLNQEKYKSYLKNGNWNTVGQNSTILDDLLCLLKIIKTPITSVIFKDEKHTVDILNKLIKSQYAKQLTNNSLVGIGSILIYKSLLTLNNERPKYKPNSLTNKIAIEISKVLKVHLIDVSHTTLLNSLYTHNLYPLYLAYKCNNKSDISDLISEYTKIVNIAKEELNIKAIKNKEQLQSLKLNVLSVDHFNIPFTNLTDAKQKIILSMYDQNEKKADIGKFYPMKVVSLLYSIDPIVRERAFKELTKIEADASVKLSVFVCQHILDLCAAHTEDSRTRVIRKYAVYDNSISTYFCEKCGEILYRVLDNSEIDKNIRIFAQDVNLLERQIWGQTSYIVNKFVNIKIGYNVNEIIKSITKEVLPFIDAIDVKLHKIRSISEAKVNDMLAIYISVYVFVSILHISETYKGVISIIRKVKNTKIFEPITDEISSIYESNSDTVEDSSDIESDESVKETDPIIKVDTSIDAPDVLGGLENSIKNDITNIIQIVNSIHNVQIVTTDISIDVIKSILITAYKQVSKLVIDKVEDQTVSLISAHLSSDPIYQLITIIYKVNNPNKPGTIFSILNIADKDELLNIKSVFDNIPLETPDGKENSTEDSIYKQLFIQSYNLLVKYISSKIPKQGVPEAPELLELYTENIEELQWKRNAFIIIRTARYTKALPMNKSYKFIRQAVGLSYLYDSHGRRYKFNIFVMLNKKTKKIYNITTKEIQSMIGTPEYDNSFLIDMKDENSNMLQSKVLLEGSVKALDNIFRLKAFYALYRFKCPMSFVHVFDNFKCTKCHLTYDQINTMDVKYFDKYNKVHGKQELHIPVKVEFKILRSSEKLITSSIGKISKLLSVDYSRLYNLGMTEVSLNTIKTHSGATKIEANTIKDISDDRNMRLIDYYDSFVLFYAKVKNHVDFKYNGDVRKMIAKYTMADIDALLDTRQLDRNRRYQLSVEHYSYYILQFMFDEIMRLIEASKGKTQQLCIDITSFSINQMLQNDIYYGPYSVNTLKIASAVSSDLENVIDDINDDLTPAVDAKDIFSFSEVDFDASEDADNIE